MNQRPSVPAVINTCQPQSTIPHAVSHSNSTMESSAGTNSSGDNNGGQNEVPERDKAGSPSENDVGDASKRNAAGPHEHDDGPDLSQCVHVLQSMDISRSSGSRNSTNSNSVSRLSSKRNNAGSPAAATATPKELADQYTAAVGLLLHLRRDQQRLDVLRDESKDTDGKNTTCIFPNPESIPAMTAVVNNQSLFQSLLSCLYPSPSDGVSSSGIIDVGGAASTGTSSTSSNFHTVQNALFSSLSTTGGISSTSDSGTANPRKRTHSMDGTTELSSKFMPGGNKSAKLGPGVSPHISGGKRTVNNTLAGNNGTNNNPSPRFDIKVVAATILYVAFEPLDQWPVPLVEAYAEDCFGPRLWVDNPDCQLLVENLRLIHHQKQNGSDNSNSNGQDNRSNRHVDDEMKSDAALLAEFYKKQKDSRHIPSLKVDTESEEELSIVGSATPKISPRSINSPQRSPVDGAGMMPIAPSLKRSRSNSVESQLPSSLKPSSFSDSNDPSGKLLRSLSVSPKASKQMQSLEPTQNGGSVGGRAGDMDDGSSSSSGEDEDIEDISVDDRRDRSLSPRSFTASTSSLSPPPPMGCVDSKLTYPIQQKMLNFDRSSVRQRFFGSNLEYAESVVADKLQQRLDVKAKQAGLLQCLPTFTSIPSVRRLVTSYLEKWLQSPALAGLSRILFKETVENMEFVDPPLEDDLAALDNILAMRLKANQLNAHIENIKAVAAKIPTQAVARRIYYQILSDERDIAYGVLDGRSSSDLMTMIKAVHEAFPLSLCADGLASALLRLSIKNPRVESGDGNGNDKLVRHILRKVAANLAGAFDAYELLVAMKNQNLREWQDETYTWSLADEEIKARLMFCCATLVVDPSVLTDQAQISMNTLDDAGLPSEAIYSQSSKILQTRKVLLSWCCLEYAPLCPTSLIDPSLTTISGVKNDRSGNKRKKKDEISGAGPPDYSSILDEIGEANFPYWLSVIRCLLFLEYPGSDILDKFLLLEPSSGQNENMSEEQLRRIRFCCDFGADLDDEMIQIVLDGASSTKASIPTDVALMVLEHMFHACTKDKKPSIIVRDPDVVWKLYGIVEYKPPPQNPESGFNGESIGDQEVSLGSPNMTSSKEYPRLAYPGLWWRTTCLALILCGSSTKIVGAKAFQEHPTLRALIKMVTSDRYRFPTVDCDDSAREEQKKTEQEMRDEEAKITELLFSPPKKVTKKKKKEDFVSNGYRVSRRQQEKREKMLKLEREKEEAEARAEAVRRRKTLKAAQKSIMLWDPTKGPRKPPKESADLIFSVGELFDLPKVFQSSTSPDFVMLTIGSTSRGAIERAYDWLIPIISFFPDTISRLPASASCFLLLRAYGTEGEEQSQLQELSAPLLQHVHDSLVGKFGQESAIRAFDLLLTEFSSHNPDRRRCARRVLQNAIGLQELNDKDTVFAGSNHTWVVKMLQTDNAAAICPVVMKHVAKAATYERGSNLRYLVFALKALTEFAISNGLPGDWDFRTILTELISRRPTVFAASISSFPQLRSLTVQVIHDSFKVYVADSAEMKTNNPDDVVEMCLCRGPTEASKDSINTHLPVALLQATCVLLSVWSEDVEDDLDAAPVHSLVDMMMNSDGHDADVLGLKSAKFINTGKRAISVELWTMLAKARSDFIAKRAALAAPTSYLPRLLLCSGLPKASLVTMVDRLGKLGDESDDKAKVYNQVLLSYAASTWDIGRLGSRREISRKLLGRLSAYQRMYNLSGEKDDSGELINFAFVKWLPDACQVAESKSSKLKTKFKKPKIEQASTSATPGKDTLGTIDEADSLLGLIPNSVSHPAVADMDMELDGDTSDMTKFLDFRLANSSVAPTSVCDMSAVKDFIHATFDNDEPHLLNDWLSIHYRYPLIPKRKFRLGGKDVETLKEVNGVDVAILLMQLYANLKRKVESLASIVLKWVPLLSVDKGSSDLWKIVFAEGQKPSIMWDNLLSRCLQIWTHVHVTKCRDWLLSEGKYGSLDQAKVVRLLIEASTFSCVHVESFVDIPVTTNDTAWCRSEETVRVATNYAIDCVLSCSKCEGRLRSRNDVPDGLVLLILISRMGKNQVQFVCNMVIDKLRADSTTERDGRSSVLLACILRLYAYFPLSVNLGAVEVRNSLKDAVELFATDWLSWRSPLDDSIQDMLDVVLSPPACTPKAVQTMVDTAKRHPLLLLRKTGQLVKALEADGITRDDRTMSEKLGLVVGRSLESPLISKVKGGGSSKSIKITVKYWGFNYTENLWMVLLDILAAVPHEVLFGCGLTMGLTELLDVYVRLAYIQSQLVTKGDRFSKLKGRYWDFLTAFRNTNNPSWDAWLGTTNSGLESIGSTRNILMSVGYIDLQQALDHVKKNPTNT